MGLLDMFGKGGGTLAIEIDRPRVRCGENLQGTLVFEGGKRSQRISGFQIWFIATDGENEELLWAPSQTEVSEEIQPGQTKRFAFDVKVPHAARVRVNGEQAKTYAVKASLDIPREIDPQASRPPELEGTLDAEVTVG